MATLVAHHPCNHIEAYDLVSGDEELSTWLYTEIRNRIESRPCLACLDRYGAYFYSRHMIWRPVRKARRGRIERAVEIRERVMGESREAFDDLTDNVGRKGINLDLLKAARRALGWLSWQDEANWWIECGNTHGRDLLLRVAAGLTGTTIRVGSNQTPRGL